MLIALTPFASKRHFQTEDFGGTKVRSHTPSVFEGNLNAYVETDKVRWADGYEPFCKHVFVPNFTDARLGDMEITPENEHCLRSGYETRREGELPFLSRWFVSESLKAAGIEVPVAPWLDVIVYSGKHLLEEEDQDIGGAEWGIVAVLAIHTDDEPPMTPMTAMRNALGAAEGGSGVAIDREYFAKCVAHWSKRAVVR